MSSESLWNRTVPVRRRAKKPTPGEWGMPNHPSPLMSRRDYENHSARSSGFRIDLIPAPSHELPCSGLSRFRPRLQRRVRDGFTPSSLVPNKNRLYVHTRAYQTSVACQENTRKKVGKIYQGGGGGGMIQKTVTLSMFNIRVELTIRKNCATPSGCPN